jgi:hypothetical protein
MNVPVPRNRLIALTVLGVVLTGLVSVTLASPTLLFGDAGDAQPENSNTLASDAPTPNESFTPAVQSQDGGGDSEEEERYEEHEEVSEDESEEHEEDD